MAPTTQQTASNTTGHAEGHRRLRDWTTRFHAALSDTEAYGKVHHGLFREFEQLCDEVRGSDRRSIIPYVDAIFNHTASQGYQQAVHYDPLFNGLVAYCKNLPPPIWVAPADQFDKSPTPTLPPIPKETSRSPSRTIAPRPLPKKLSHNPAHIPKAAGPAQPTKTGKQATDMPQAGPGPGTIAKGKGRADKAVKRGATSMPATATVHVKHLPKGKKRSKLSKDWIDITTDDEEKESSEEEKKSVPSANQKEPVKCVTCERDGHPCMTNPSTVGNVSPACYECFQRKRKCSLCTKPAGESRKKKTTVAVAAGSAGELTSWGVPKDLAERFDQYENQANSNREELKEMAQQLAALRSENSTLQRYFADRLVAMYENLARRDVGITEALRVMLTFNSREQAQSAHFRDEIVRLEALLRQPAADDAPLPTLQPHRLPSLPPAAELDPPADGPATPTDMPPPIEAPQKRAMTPDPDDSGGPPKRQKS